MTFYERRLCPHLLPCTLELNGTLQSSRGRSQSPSGIFPESWLILKDIVVNFFALAREGGRAPVRPFPSQYDCSRSGKLSKMSGIAPVREQKLQSGEQYGPPR